MVLITNVDPERVDTFKLEVINVEAVSTFPIKLENNKVDAVKVDNDTVIPANVENRSELTTRLAEPVTLEVV